MKRKAKTPPTPDLPPPPPAAPRSRIREWLSRHGATALEIAAIAVWVLFVGRSYLTADSLAWPGGREFGSQVVSHYAWIEWKQCGACALWNGAVNGGMPSLGDVFGSTLTPLVAIPTLLGGMVAGAKVAVILSLFLAGLAQWWMARVIGLGRVARMWSALIVVVAGHLTGRLEGGAIGLVISTAAVSAAFAAALALGITGRRRHALILAMLGALAVVSGQGYLQAALLAVAPAFLFLILDGSGRAKPVWREFALAFGLAVLLGAVFLIPAGHFLPEWFKGIDPLFQASQPLGYVPLNLVISDPAYFQGTVLGKLPYPYLYNLYVGWVPLILAILSLTLARRRDLPALLCLASSVLLAFFFASGTPLRWLGALVPALAGFRHTPLLAGLAVPSLIALSAYGLDGLLRLDWPRIALGWDRAAPGGVRSVSLIWLLAIPLAASFRTPLAMSGGALGTMDRSSIYEEIGALATPSLQWIATPFGEHFWIEPAMEHGLKVANVVWAWNWKERTLPPPRIVATRGDPPPDMEVTGSLGDIPVYVDPAVEFATVETPSGVVPCRAHGAGGELTVECTIDEPGTLIVQENVWTGWQAWIDDTPAELLPGQWLSVAAPQGTHEFVFRYRPLDAPLGLLVSLAGLGLWIALWVRSPGVRPDSDAEEERTAGKAGAG